MKSGTGGEDEAADDLREYGATEEQIAEILGDDEDGDEAFELWPENARAIEVFLALQTQWLVGAMGGFLGLNYLAAEAAMRMMKVKNRRAMFDDLRAMEAAALPILNASEPK